jgi:hypothetical protein
MIARLAIATWLLACCAAALAQEQAFTNRATELKDKASTDAATLATLPESTPVKVLARGGGWTRVEAGGQSGWVRVFHLRFPAVVESTSSSGALGSLGAALGLGGSKSREARLASTGIRGLSQEDLKNASPDPEALRRLQSYRADRSTAERFAREAKLAAVHVDAPAEGAGAKEGRR